jgi:hypothetical protein
VERERATSGSASEVKEGGEKEERCASCTFTASITPPRESEGTQANNATRQKLASMLTAVRERPTVARVRCVQQECAKVQSRRE